MIDQFEFTPMMSRCLRRVQLSRKKGFRLPYNAKSIAYPTRWANPFRPKVRSYEANLDAVQQYEAFLKTHHDLVIEGRESLRGYYLACWCPLEIPCHGDTWIRVVNYTAEELDDWLFSE